MSSSPGRTTFHMYSISYFLKHFCTHLSVLLSTREGHITSLSPPLDSGKGEARDTKFMPQGHRPSEYRNRSQIWCPGSQESALFPGNVPVWIHLFDYLGKEEQATGAVVTSALMGNTFCSPSSLAHKRGKYRKN